jgi:hypothetical protein
MLCSLTPPAPKMFPTRRTIRKLPPPQTVRPDPRIGREIGEVENNEEGIQPMKVLGRDTAWLLKETTVAPARQPATSDQITLQRAFSRALNRTMLCGWERRHADVLIRA